MIACWLKRTVLLFYCDRKFDNKIFEVLMEEQGSLKCLYIQRKMSDVGVRLLLHSIIFLKNVKYWMYFLTYFCIE